MNHKTIAVIPVHGRTPLVALTVRRLLNINGCSEVICVGNLKQDAEACKEEGAKWVDFSNQHLGAKWNAGFMAARSYDPDSCLFVGSSDWLSASWLPAMQGYMEKYDVAGKADTYFLDWRKPHNYRLLHWPGYMKSRKGESIGIGRLVSRRILTKLEWQPFDPSLDSSMDYSMMQKVAGHQGTTICVTDANIVSLSISCSLWLNKHNWEREAEHPKAKTMEPFAFMDQWGFTQIRELFG